MVRAPAVDKNGLKKGAWSREEDDKLRAYIQRYGHWNWRQLPKFAGLSRCGKSCRLRWMNYLRPDVKRGNFSEEEDALIIQMHKELGNRWSRIATKLPGRTDNEIKNHWHTNLNKPAKRNQSASEISTQFDQASRQTSENSESVSVNTPSSESDLLHHQKINVDQCYPSSQEVLSCSTVSLSNGSMSASGSEDSFSSMDIMFQDLSADFWTLPFLADNNDDNDPLFLSEGECVTSSLYASNNYDDSIDWMQQVMKELEDSTINY